MDENKSLFDYIQQLRAGRSIKRPKKILASTDERGWITITNETGRICIDDNKPSRVLLTADLRKGHPLLKPGILGRTIPNTSDYYRYVGVEFDCGVIEVISISAIQPLTEEACEISSAVFVKKVQGTLFDWDEETARQKTREWETKTFSPILDIKKILRGGEGPQEVYAYTFPSLIALAASKGMEQYPVKIGYTGTSGEIAPSLSRINSQLGDATGRFEPATVLLVWNSWNGRKLENRIHSHLRSLNRRCESAIGREWYTTNIDELVALLSDVRQEEVSRLPLNGPVPDSFDGNSPPSRVFAENIIVLCSGMGTDANAFMVAIDFDDLLEDAATSDVVRSRVERRDRTQKE
jgi:hypothetical protein